MIFESLAIIGIVLAIGFIILRSKRNNYFMAILPLLILPLMHIISFPVVPLLSKVMPAREITIYICLIFIALIVESILIGLASTLLKTRKQKTSFLFMCGAFSLVLTMIYILDALKTAFPI